MRYTPIGPALLALFLAGCAGNASDLVAPRDRVILVVSVSPREGVPGSPVVVTALVENQGRDPIRYFEGCAGESFSFSIAGPSGPVHATDPCAPVPLCAGWTVVLPRSGTHSQDFDFNGTLYRDPADPTAPCDTYVAQPGDYTATVRFTYMPEGMQEVSRVLERSATFHWPGPQR